jgi:hypothetical protein
MERSSCVPWVGGCPDRVGAFSETITAAEVVPVSSMCPSSPSEAESFAGLNDPRMTGRRSTPVPNESEEDGDSVIEPESGSDHSAQPINTLAADTIKSLQMPTRVRPFTPSSCMLTPRRIAAALYQNR